MRDLADDHKFVESGRVVGRTTLELTRPRDRFSAPHLHTHFLRFTPLSVDDGDPLVFVLTTVRLGPPFLGHRAPHRPAPSETGYAIES